MLQREQFLEVHKECKPPLTRNKLQEVYSLWKKGHQKTGGLFSAKEFSIDSEDGGRDSIYFKSSAGEILWNRYYLALQEDKEIGSYENYSKIIIEGGGRLTSGKKLTKAIAEVSEKAKEDYDLIARLGDDIKLLGSQTKDPVSQTRRLKMELGWDIQDFVNLGTHTNIDERSCFATGDTKYLHKYTLATITNSFICYIFEEGSDKSYLSGRGFGWYNGKTNSLIFTNFYSDGTVWSKDYLALASGLAKSFFRNNDLTIYSDRIKVDKDILHVNKGNQWTFLPKFQVGFQAAAKQPTLRTEHLPKGHIKWKIEKK